MIIKKEELQALQAHIEKKINEIQFSPSADSAELFDLNMLDSNLSLFLLNAEFHDGPLELGPKDKKIIEALRKFREAKVDPDNFSAAGYIEEISVQAAELLEMLQSIQDSVSIIPEKTLASNLNLRFDLAYENISQVARLLTAEKSVLKKWVTEEMPLPSTNAGKTLGKIRTEKKAEAARENGKKGGRPRKTPEPEVKTVKSAAKKTTAAKKAEPVKKTVAKKTTATKAKKTTATKAESKTKTTKAATTTKTKKTAAAKTTGTKATAKKTRTK